MSTSDETFIVRVRAQEGDAVVEQPSVARRRRVRDVADVGPLIVNWVAQPTGDDGPAPESAGERRAP
jgi:hypothetical protein